VNLLVLLGAWFAAGVLTTLLIGPRLRRAAEAAGTPVEPEPVFPAGRSPLRWRLGTLGVVGLLAGSTGMAAAGALPGSAQTIAHHVLGSVGMHVPKEAAPEVVAAPATPPWGDVGHAGEPTTTSELGEGDGSTEAAPTVEAGDPPADTPATVDDGGTTDTTADLDAGVSDDAGDSDASPPSSTPSTEPSDVPDDGTGEEPSDVPADPPSEEPPTTTTTVPSPEPPPDPGTPTSSPSTTTTTSTVPPDDPPPPPAG